TTPCVYTIPTILFYPAPARTLRAAFLDLARLGELLARIAGRIRVERLRHVFPLRRAPANGDRQGARAGKLGCGNDGRHGYDRRGDVLTIAKLEAADGAFATRLAGVDVVFRMSSALWLPGERILVVADLHLDKD